MGEKKFKLYACISSSTPSAIKPVLERIIGSEGTIKPTGDGFEVNAELKGESARDLNRTLLYKDSSSQAGTHNIQQVCPRGEVMNLKNA
jgi:hypothetical protein